MVAFEEIYPGQTHLLDPDQNFTGYRVKAGHIGGTTGVQTANQLKEVDKILDQGIDTTEVHIIDANVLEMVPKEHFTEINRLNKLAGAESTLHAPAIDPAGIIENRWSEENQELAVMQFNEAIERGHALNKQGNMPVTFHSSNSAGSTWIPDPDNKGKEVMQQMIAIDQESGQPVPIKREYKYRPNQEKPELINPLKEIKVANASHWDNELFQTIQLKENGDKIIREFYPVIANADTSTNEARSKLSPTQQAAVQQVDTGHEFIQNSYMQLTSVYNKAMKYSTNDKTKEILKQVAKKFREDLAKSGGMGSAPGMSQAMEGLIGGIKAVTQGAYEPYGAPIPEKYLQAEKFANEKASDTMSKVAINSYKKFGENAPVISIENPPYGMAISNGRDLKKFVNTTRDKFVKGLVKEGKSKSEAKKMAEKLIGVTWDTSHINMIRKQGFDKDKVVGELKEVAPLVKHVHFNDNFGTTHTDLPPGMGDVPFKKVMKELDKVNFEGKKIFEGGGFVSQFQQTPMPYVLEQSGSPIYSTGASPYWNQMGVPGSYFMGYGPINPQVHHSIYSSSFTTLPVELGGDMGGQANRFSGTPNN